MNADAARNAGPTIEPDRLKQAGRRLRSAQEKYDNLVGGTSSETVEQEPVTDELRTAGEELRAAKQEFLPLYGQHLRADPEFQKESKEAEQRLAEGPPWDDLIYTCGSASQGGFDRSLNARAGTFAGWAN